MTPNKKPEIPHQSRGRNLSSSESKRLSRSADAGDSHRIHLAAGKAGVPDTDFMMVHRKPAGIYIHIPFCVRKCNYCAFLSAPASETKRAEYVDSLIREIELRRGEVPFADTIYFGGGTPSLLTPSQIHRILDAVKNNFVIAGTSEVTMEANPGALTAESLRGYREAGVNRLSMGVQSMDDRRLRFLGRIHTAEDVRRDYVMAREAGLDNINLDLMFGIPGMTLADAVTDLQKIAELEPEHISFYSLQLEEGTPFFRAFEAGELTEVPDELDREMYHRGIKFLQSQGYEHYEISNFCKPGFRSRHNSKYWDLSEYVGLGLGASSYVNHTRIMNETDFEAYGRKLDRGELPQGDVHENSEFDDVSEAVFTGLRRREGIRFEEVAGSKAHFFEIYGEAMEELEQFRASGDVEITPGGIRLTEQGIDISNRIMALFV